MGIFATGIALVALWSPPDPEAVRAALERVLAERPYQTTLPGVRRWESRTPIDPTADDRPTSSGRTDGDPIRDPNGAPSTGIDPRDETRRRTGHTSDHRDPDAEVNDDTRPREASGVGAAIFWITLCVLAALALVWLVSEWTGREKKRDLAATRANQPPAPMPTMPVVPLDEVDRLAAAGQFGEAIHLLLLRTIAGLANAAASLAPSHTSREILVLAPFRPGAREELTGLVDAVEVSLFGGRVVGEAAYLDCRARFDRFAAIQSGGAA